ncbi:hypothetical protein SAMN05216215_106148 [Saccharopolyspora shandongensis]|uniref:Uncharacterized protein n=1 Tax=Saccharopolyspora shandongensis TaxID=418495 RepID=A0A1H3S8U9_9PSEU|nr:hypothetical protein [Saccharopolyspora shandongensis]SDZ34177.1 hypothetical protein SAMN05216215_106148 [Saccharopolyspora shandongensis]
MGEGTWDSQAGSPSAASAPEIIPVHLDLPTRFALAALTSDGTTVSDAVRAAIIEAGARRAEQRLSDKARASTSETLEEWARRQAAVAPPLSECQVYVLRAAFHENRLVGTCPVRHRRAETMSRFEQRMAPCHAPSCFAEPLEPSDIPPPA